MHRPERLPRFPAAVPINAILALEDGRCFEGNAFGATGTTTGEICFNTSMTGYQEVITDPSYRGQIVSMTYPQIGNYGVNPLDGESGGPHKSSGSTPTRAAVSRSISTSTSARA